MAPGVRRSAVQGQREKHLGTRSPPCGWDRGLRSPGGRPRPGSDQVARALANERCPRGACDDVRRARRCARAVRIRLDARRVPGRPRSRRAGSARRSRDRSASTPITSRAGSRARRSRMPCERHTTRQCRSASSVSRRLSWDLTFSGVMTGSIRRRVPDSAWHHELGGARPRWGIRAPSIADHLLSGNSSFAHRRSTHSRLRAHTY